MRVVEGWIFRPSIHGPWYPPNRIRHIRYYDECGKLIGEFFGADGWMA